MLLSFLSFLFSFEFWIIVSSFVSKILPTVKLLTLNTHGCARDEEKFRRVVISAMPNHRVSQICTDTSSKEKRHKVSTTYRITFLVIANFFLGSSLLFPSRLADPFLHWERISQLHTALHASPRNSQPPSRPKKPFGILERFSKQDGGARPSG